MQGRSDRRAEYGCAAFGAEDHMNEKK